MGAQTTIQALADAEKVDPAWSAPVRALWRDLRGEWDAAHREVQDDDSPDGAWVHAYLHRKEGDISNARYWYARAGRPASSALLTEEWKEIAAALLPAKAER